MAKHLSDPNHFLAVARKHLDKVTAARNPPDYSELGTYGLYCLEALVRAAALKKGLIPETDHYTKVKQAEQLARAHHIRDVSRLIKELNKHRKAEAYGDINVDLSKFDVNNIVDQVAEYSKQVHAL